MVAGTRESLLPQVDVVVNDDELGARIATRHLLELGHRRITYDETVFARLRRVSLTTIDSRSADVGREAAQVLVSRLAGDDGEPRGRLLAPRLVVRSSTAAPSPAR